MQISDLTDEEEAEDEMATAQIRDILKSPQAPDPEYDEDEEQRPRLSRVSITTKDG